MKTGFDFCDTPGDRLHLRKSGASNRIYIQRRRNFRRILWIRKIRLVVYLHIYSSGVRLIDHRNSFSTNDPR